MVALAERPAVIDIVTLDSLAAGQRLPDGGDSGSQLQSLDECISRLREGRFGLKGNVKDLVDFLDPSLNPRGFRLHQNRALASGTAELLLALAQSGGGDEKNRYDGSVVRGLAWEGLARLVFGNNAAAETLAGKPELVPALRGALAIHHGGSPPEQLCAVQLVQALASSAGVAARASVPELIGVVAPLLKPGCPQFRALAGAAFDVLVSSSFRHASAVADAVGWPELATVVVGSWDQPEWLPAEPLRGFLCGLLATDLLTLPPPSSESQSRAREEIKKVLTGDRFFMSYEECLRAAVARREWPNGTQAYHSPLRLAELAGRLTALGHSRRLVLVTESLAAAVEAVLDDQVTRAALLSLRALGDDIECLEALLAMSEFRRETLEALHRGGDEPEATRLLSYLDSCELALMGAQEILDAATPKLHNAPTVRQLAEIFQKLAPLDAELTAEQLLQATAEVPLIPSAEVEASQAGAQNVGFQAFAALVYGTPRVLGLWPTLMEDAASVLRATDGLASLPTLPRLAQLFEEVADGKSTMSAHALLERALPSLGLPTEGPVVELEFVEIRGDTALDFKAFVAWLGGLCVRLSEEPDATPSA